MANVRDAVRDLIEKYRESECLWKLSSPFYKNRQKRRSALETLVPILRRIDRHADILAVTKKINSLRSSFKKEHNKIKTWRQSGETYVPNLWYYESMKFLLEIENADSGNQTAITDTQIDTSKIKKQKHNASGCKKKHRRIKRYIWMPPDKKNVFAKSVKEKQLHYGKILSKQAQLDNSEELVDYSDQWYEYGKYVAERLISLDVQDAHKAQKEIEEVLSRFSVNKIQPDREEPCTEATSTVAPVEPAKPAVSQSEPNVNASEPLGNTHVFTHVAASETRKQHDSSGCCKKRLGGIRKFILVRPDTKKMFVKSIKEKQVDHGHIPTKEARLDNSEEPVDYSDQWYKYGQYIAERLMSLDVQDACIAQKEIEEVLSRFSVNKIQPDREEHCTEAISTVAPVAPAEPAVIQPESDGNSSEPLGNTQVFTHVDSSKTKKQHQYVLQKFAKVSDSIKNSDKSENSDRGVPTDTEKDFVKSIKEKQLDHDHTQSKRARLDKLEEPVENAEKLVDNSEKLVDNSEEPVDNYEEPVKNSEEPVDYSAVPSGSEEWYKFGKIVAEILMRLDIEDARVAQKEIEEVLSRFMSKIHPVREEPSKEVIKIDVQVKPTVFAAMQSESNDNTAKPLGNIHVFTHVSNTGALNIKPIKEETSTEATDTVAQVESEVTQAKSNVNTSAPLLQLHRANIHAFTHVSNTKVLNVQPIKEEPFTEETETNVEPIAFPVTQPKSKMNTVEPPVNQKVFTHLLITRPSVVQSSSGIDIVGLSSTPSDIESLQINNPLTDIYSVSGSSKSTTENCLRKFRHTKRTLVPQSKEQYDKCIDVQPATSPETSIKLEPENENSQSPENATLQSKILRKIINFESDSDDET